MTIVCTVRIPHPLERVTAYEADRADLMGPITQAAMQHMSGHRRIENDDEVIDLDEFPAMADYEAFMAAAGEQVREYNAEMGVMETHYRVVEGG